jgi:hypothetical protein
MEHPGEPSSGPSARAPASSTSSPAIHPRALRDGGPGRTRVERPGAGTISSTVNSLASLVPLVGVIIGATLSYVLTRSHDAKKQRDAVRRDVYADYLKATASLAHAMTSTEETKAREALTSAKARMCISAGNAMLQALREFERTGAQLSSEDGINAFIDLAIQMRVEMGETGVNRQDLSVLLFGKLPLGAGKALKE